MDNSYLLLNCIRNIIRVYFFLYIWPEIFMPQYILHIFGSQVTYKGVIVLFFQDFYSKNTDIEYIQYKYLVKKLLHYI